MITLRKSADRASTRLEWLESRHGFSFGQHYDPTNLGFGPLRVINEDWIAPRAGFPPHPHRDMEILTYMLAGTLTHHDSEGNAVEIRPGRMQAMHAGSGITHSEINFDTHAPVHLLQIWIEPDTLGIDPGHTELDYALEPGSPVVLASPSGRSGGVAIAQDATVSALALDPGQSTTLHFDSNRRGWLQVPVGSGRVEAAAFEAGDAFAIEGERRVRVEATAACEMLVFDLP